MKTYKVMTKEKIKLNKTAAISALGDIAATAYSRRSEGNRKGL